ncbi:uncharacterized protein CEXT_274261 [Caerostris extrusa]|uniref:Uncharacterized protein n=1 Tax=Caerostris extrusa TaxID=172846 RepID=A0AAV4XZ37_CAEEX|nr:uncharacterized protein CEXT_274261 [Caerostris extrusa]
MDLPFSAFTANFRLLTTHDFLQGHLCCIGMANTVSCVGFLQAAPLSLFQIVPQTTFTTSKQNNNKSSNFGDNSHLAVCENPYKNISPRLHEVELHKFGGELRDWLTFWNQFKNIHENKNLTNCDKFHYLVQSTKIKSEARELIESFPITDENYHLVIESLTERYGRKERYYEEFPKKLQDSYVDNCVTSVQNIAELEIFVESATNVMKEGMLDRRGCESSALSASSESTRSPVLGLIWDKNLNALEIDTEYLEFDEREKITKRKILSLVSRLFDPIGFLALVMIQPKILLQTTWKEKEIMG